MTNERRKMPGRSAAALSHRRLGRPAAGDKTVYGLIERAASEAASVTSLSCLSIVVPGQELKTGYEPLKELTPNLGVANLLICGK
jgi:hypothetical protein